MQSFHICQEYIMKGGYGEKTAKLMQANINPESGRFELRFAITFHGIEGGQWVCMEDTFYAMLSSGDLRVKTIGEICREHFDEELFTL